MLYYFVVTDFFSLKIFLRVYWEVIAYDLANNGPTLNEE